jgi:hypothetical protein
MQSVQRGWLVKECVRQFAQMGLTSPPPANAKAPEFWTAFEQTVSAAQAEKAGQSCIGMAVVNDKPLRYAGRLSYEGSRTDFVDVQSLLVRTASIAYSLASVTKKYGRWSTGSGSPALLQPDGTYLAKGVSATQHGMSAAYTWDIRFKILAEMPGEYIGIGGYIQEAHAESRFSGELDSITLSQVK